MSMSRFMVNTRRHGAPMARSLLCALGIACSLSVVGRAATPDYTLYDVDVAIDQVAPGEQAKIGDHDKIRIACDRSEMDAATKRVRLKNLQHFILGKWQPEHPDPVFMPMSDAWLDLGASPYALHYRAEVTHGKPIILEFDEHTHRLSIRSQADPSIVLLGGNYHIDPTPVTGAAAIAAATAGEVHH